MAANKFEILKDLNFCKELMDRMVEGVNNNAHDQYLSYRTVVQNDIIRLRRELNNVRRKLDWDYGFSLENEKEE